MFDEVVVAVSHNAKKTYLFSLDERVELAREALAGVGGVRVEAATGLIADFARERRAAAIVKGLRAVGDFEYELQMAQMNRELAGVETLFVPTAPQVGHLSSSLVKQIARFGGDVSSLVPKAVNDRLVAQSRGRQS